MNGEANSEWIAIAADLRDVRLRQGFGGTGFRTARRVEAASGNPRSSSASAIRSNTVATDDATVVVVCGCAAIADSSTPSSQMPGTFCDVGTEACQILAAKARCPRGIPFAWAGDMSEISRFYGIVIRMLDERGARHHLPHFHATYGEWTATVAIDSVTVLGGKLPARQQRLVDAWAELHRAELLENWELLNSGQPTFKIKPLA